jgi:hypothetical protein
MGLLGHVSATTVVIMDSNEKKPVFIQFDLKDDQFPHAWYYNRFRVDTLGDSKLVTLALVTGSGTLAVNAFVLSNNDVAAGRERNLKFLEGAKVDSGEVEEFNLGFSQPPARVYPVNHVNLSRIDQTAEISLYRHSVHSLVNQMNEARKAAGTKTPLVNAYPVVLFRSDLKVLLALVKELHAT